eukprot:c7889_g1_i4.p1 GENE.c7889_g1_i4~~c7889_g1_i4.p1  ORF type:complete len:119 (+),score=12.92 c7889_g1_i4:32-388(+)
MVHVARDGTVTSTAPAIASVWSAVNGINLFFQTLFSPLPTEEFIAEQRGQTRVSTLNGSAGSNRMGSGGGGGSSGPGGGGNSGPGGGHTGSNIAGMQNVRSNGGGSCGGGGCGGGGCS